MKIAFIVLTYNQPEMLLQVLNGLAPQCGPEHEVVIADDGSAPAAIETLRQNLPQFQCRVSHVWHPDNGFTAARARNLAAANSHADYLVFMDGDCIPNPHFVQAHARLQEPGFFVNGSRVLLNLKLSQKILAHQMVMAQARWYDWLGWRVTGQVNKLLHLWRWPDGALRKEQHFRWKQIRSCNFGVWRDDFLRINGFDETFQGWGHEDADLVLRLHNAGLQRKNGFCATEVYHLWHRENNRDHESGNRQLVLQRVHSGLVRALSGVSNARAATDVCVTHLN